MHGCILIIVPFYLEPILLELEGGRYIGTIFPSATEDFLTGGAPTSIHQGEALADAAAAASTVEAEAEVEAESMGEVRVESGPAIGPEDQEVAQ